MKRSLWAIGACVALALATFAGRADADVKLRVGKAQAQQFAFVPVHVGIEAGIFKKHGLEIEVSNFGGDAKLMQALAADGIDIALGGGPTLAFVQKGTPMLGIAALADAPGTIMLVVLKDGPVKTEDDLKGRTVSVSTAGSLTYWLAKELSRSKGWGNDGIKIAPLGTPGRANGGAQDRPDRRRRHRDQLDLPARGGGQRPHPGAVPLTASRTSTSMPPSPATR